jgi:hypothetical protein
VAGAEAGHFRLWLKEGVSVGSAIGALLADGIDVLTCREEVSDVEEAFVVVTEGVG